MLTLTKEHTTQSKVQSNSKSFIAPAPIIQKKLEIGASDDQYEMEADRIADQVVQMKPIAVDKPKPTNTVVQRKCKSCEDEERIRKKPLLEQITPLIQRRTSSSNGQAVASNEISTAINQSRGNGRPLGKETKQIMESGFGTDFSKVRVHTDSNAINLSKELNAQAFTVGNDVFFNEGKYNPSSNSGKHLLAHELTHTVQQGIVNPKIQRRRVPQRSDLNLLYRSSSRDGFARMLSRAWAGLSSLNQARVKNAAVRRYGIRTWRTEEQLRRLLSRKRRPTLLRFARQIIRVQHSLRLGDPALINIGPRTGTSDAANIATLVNEANTIFLMIASGSKDMDIGQIFGISNINAAKIKYNNAKVRMNQLHLANKIVTDRSGYNSEVGLGGLTNHQRIGLSPNVIDNPTREESIVILIHESMHAGNSGVVRDRGGYVHQPSFTSRPSSDKLNNAAHYEVVPRRILNMNYAFAGETFIPAGTTVGGVTRPALTPRQEAIQGAKERFTKAWTKGLNLHSHFVRVYHNPSEWNSLNLGPIYGVSNLARFSNTLPYWSKVEMLTTHTRLSAINPTGSNNIRPFTLVDIALSEGLIRKLSIGMRNTPRTPAEAIAFENAHATAAERASAITVNAKRDLLIKLVINQHTGSITGNFSRDYLVLERLAQAHTGGHSDTFTVRNNLNFP